MQRRLSPCNASAAGEQHESHRRPRFIAGWREENPTFFRSPLRVKPSSPIPRIFPPSALKIRIQQAAQILEPIETALISPTSSSCNAPSNMILSAPKTVFLTGASSGIGRAIAEKFLSENHRVWGTPPAILTAWPIWRKNSPPPSPPSRSTSTTPTPPKPLTNTPPPRPAPRPPSTSSSTTQATAFSHLTPKSISRSGSGKSTPCSPPPRAWRTPRYAA